MINEGFIKSVFITSKVTALRALTVYQNALLHIWKKFQNKLIFVLNEELRLYLVFWMFISYNIFNYYY